MSALVVGAAAVLALFLLLWAASVLLEDASIVDPFWGPGFVVAAWVYVAFSPADPLRGAVVAGLVTLWGLRLGVHLGLRKLREPEEDRRYRRMREGWGDAFPWVSLATVFLLQAAILVVVSLPLWQAARSEAPSFPQPLDLAGLALFLAGFAMETVADFQLTRFRQNPENEGEVLDSGLWRWSRHPNYFGECLLWWGLSLPALATGAWWVLVSPALMTFLLLKVSGVSLLEKDMEDRRPAYRDYVRRTSAFFPLPPRERGRAGASD